MLKKLVNFEKHFSVTKAAGIVGFFTLAIKFIAIYRDRLLAGTFGQGQILDTYFSAFRVPDFLTTLLVTNTLSVAFLPIFTGLLTKDEDEAYQFANQIIQYTSLIITLLCLILFIFSRPLVHIIVPGFTGPQFENTLHLTRLIFLSPILFTLSTIFGSILNAKKQFLITSFAPALYTLGIICGIVFFYPRFGIMGLGYGVVLGAIAQVFIQIVAARSVGYSFGFKISSNLSSVKHLWGLYVPRIFSFDLSNVTLILGSVIGSTLVSGSIAALNQAYNLEAVPVSVFGYSIALAVFPVLSEQFALNDERSFIDALGKSINQTLFFIIPISVLTLIYRAYVVRLILGTGNFGWDATIRTFQVLGIFSFSFFSQSLTTLLSRAFFARHNTKLPVAVNIFALIINILLGFALGPKFGVVGLTWAFVIASVCNAVALFILMRTHLHKEAEGETDMLHVFDRSLETTIWKVTLASIIMGAASYGGIKLIGQDVNTHKVLGLIIQCTVSGGFGLAVFLVCAWLLKIPETKKALAFFSRFR